MGMTEATLDEVMPRGAPAVASRVNTMLSIPMLYAIAFGALLLDRTNPRRRCDCGA